MSGLSEDLVAQILAKLPVQPLLRFRCVSKSWKALIDSKRFIHLHLKSSATAAKENPKVLFLTHKGRSHDPKINPLYHIVELHSPRGMVTTSLETHHPLKARIQRIVGCCNGLVCLTDCESYFVLWNPSIGRHWELPTPIAHDPPPLPPGWKVVSTNFMYGFGYDDGKDDYKVVRVVEPETFFSPSETETYQLEVQLYSLKSNCWRRLPRFPHLIRQAWQHAIGKLVNNALHWFCLYEFVIMAFDLKTETSRIVPLPPKDPGERSSNLYGLGVVDDSLCVMYLHTFTKLSLWILKDSWVKIVTLQPCPDFSLLGLLLLPSYSRPNSTEILFHDRDFIFAYDTEKHLVRKYHIYGGSCISMQRENGRVVVSSRDPCISMQTRENGHLFISSLVEPWSRHF